MRNNIVYQIYAPKQLLKTDRTVAILILFLGILFGWALPSLKMAIGATVACYFAIRYCQGKSKGRSLVVQIGQIL